MRAGEEIILDWLKREEDWYQLLKIRAYEVESDSQLEEEIQQIMLSRLPELESPWKELLENALEEVDFMSVAEHFTEYYVHLGEKI